MWFDVKHIPFITRGAIHIFNMLRNARNLNNDDINICLDESLNRNGYFLHSENILIAKLSDTDIGIRKLAIIQIMHARIVIDDRIRIFKIQTIDFYANCYYELIHYSGNWLELRLTMDMSSDTLLSIKVEEYPCYNQ